MNLKKIIIGYLLIVFGVMGELLPLLEGVIFVILGLLLLKDDVKWAHRLLFECTEKYTILHKGILFLSEKVDKISENLGLSHKGKK
jgi:uncharacterized membrane protein YbaN (DUF454 family)